MSHAQERSTVFSEGPSPRAPDAEQVVRSKLVQLLPRRLPWERLGGIYRPLLVVLLLGALLRLITTAFYFPAVMTSFDSPRFARAEGNGLFDDFWMPAGYPLFLKIVHRVSDQVWVSIGLQHIIGLSTAALVFLTLRWIGAPRPVALVPTAIFALNGDLLYLEHILMADQFLLVFSVLACGCVIRGLVPAIDRRWLLAAGMMAMCAMLSRSVGVAVVATMTVVVLALAPAPLKRRLVPAGVLLGGAAVVLLVYVAAFAAVGGSYLGLGDMTGWNLYARVAPFANCKKFTPPQGTRVLCERRPAAERPGPFGYVWDEQSIARKAFRPLGPDSARPLGRFARAVVASQPGDYVASVATDLARYVEPSVGTQNGYNGQPSELVSFGFRDAAVEQEVTAVLDLGYDGVRVSASADDELAAYQRITRLGWLVPLFAAGLTLFGMIVARSAARIGVWAFGLAAVGLYLVPTMSVSYDFRYGIPPGALLAVSAAIAAWALVLRYRPAASAARARPASAELPPPPGGAT